MENLFLTVLNMSFTGAFVIIAVCIARLPLKKAPKIISYCLWGVAWFRLVVPFSFESVISLIPFNTALIPPNIAMQTIPRIDSGIPFINNTVNNILPGAVPAASVNPLQVWTAVGLYIWLTGIACILIYGLVSYFKLKNKLRKADNIKDNIYETDKIITPFVIGVIKPKIYLPYDLNETENEYIIIHEQTHIKRHDHIVKIIAYIILCLHWFNPFAWIAFIFMNVDMEMSCDEQVLKMLGEDRKKDYSFSLLSLSTGKRFIGGSPLAFSEGGLKSRIKNVLKYKKASVIAIIIAVLSVTALSIGLLLNRKHEPTENNINEQSNYTAVQQRSEMTDKEWQDASALYFDNNETNYPEDTFYDEVVMLNDHSDDKRHNYLFSCIESANESNVLNIDIIEPMILPDNAILDSVIIGIDNNGDFPSAGHQIYYRFIVEGFEWNNIHVSPAFISVGKLDWGSITLQEFNVYYYSAVSDDLPPEHEYVKLHMMIGDNRAFLRAPALSSLVNDYDDLNNEHYTAEALLMWYKNDMMYSIHVYAPVNAIDLNKLIEIAESMV